MRTGSAEVLTVALELGDDHLRRRLRHFLKHRPRDADVVANLHGLDLRRVLFHHPPQFRPANLEERTRFLCRGEVVGTGLGGVRGCVLHLDRHHFSPSPQARFIAVRCLRWVDISRENEARNNLSALWRRAEITMSSSVSAWGEVVVFVGRMYRKNFRENLGITWREVSATACER